MSAYIETLPEPIEQKIRGMSGEDGALIQVATDMVGDGRYGERWLVVTPTSLQVLTPGGGEDDVHLSITSIKSVHVESLVGGGRLRVESRETEPVRAAPTLIHYSNSLALKFTGVADGINLLIEDEDPNLPLVLDATRCAKCERLLPEKGGICPACIRKTDTLARLLRFILPYRRAALALIALTLLTAVLELAPPYIVKHIIDDVLTAKGGSDLLYQYVGLLLGISLLMWGIQLWGFSFI